MYLLMIRGHTNDWFTIRLIVDIKIEVWRSMGLLSNDGDDDNSTDKNDNPLNHTSHKNYEPWKQLTVSIIKLCHRSSDL